MLLLLLVFVAMTFSSDFHLEGPREEEEEEAWAILPLPESSRWNSAGTLWTDVKPR